MSEVALPIVVLPFNDVVPATIVLPETVKLSDRVVAPVTPRVPPTVVFPVMATVEPKVAAPVTPRVEPTEAVVALRLSIYATPSMYKSLNSLEEDPKSTVLSV